MSSTVVPLVIAFLGIVGTLVSGLMTQRLAAKAKAQELDQSARQRVQERQHEAERVMKEAVRSCYGQWDFPARGHLSSPPGGHFVHSA